MITDISFIIPIYNTKIELLDRCIASIFPISKWFNIEIIAIDDGSKEFIREYFSELTLNNIVYIRKENGGVSSARNEGIKIAKGKYIFFVDADDTVESSTFLSIRNLPEYDFLILDLDVISKNSIEIWNSLCSDGGYVDIKTIINTIISSNRMNSPCAKLFCKEIISQNNILFDTSLITGEDITFVMEYLKYAHTYYYLNLVCYHYYREEKSRLSRMKKNPDVYFENIERINGRLFVLAREYSADQEYLDLLIRGKIEGLFNYYSDMIITGNLTKERAESVYASLAKVEYKKSCFKTNLKYFLLRKRRVISIKFLSYLRKLYLVLIK